MGMRDVCVEKAPLERGTFLEWWRQLASNAVQERNRSVSTTGGDMVETVETVVETVETRWRRWWRRFKH